MMDAHRRIAVTGATGRVGRHVAELLWAQGHEVVPIARSAGVDVITGEGLDEALAGVDTIVDTATGPSPDQQQATAFFTTSARNVLEAGGRAGVGRLVLVSIIGVDRFHGGYMAAKLAQEQALLAGPIPTRILRAAQFHEFVGQFLEWGRQGDVVYVPRMQSQLVSARAAAQGLVALATAPDEAWTAPHADAPILELAGPQAEQVADVAALLVSRQGNGLRVQEVYDESDPDAPVYAGGGALPSAGATLAGPTFAEWLAQAA
jgi:uncharacterized protein YbjT (DUF2867 family)